MKNQNQVAILLAVLFCLSRGLSSDGGTNLVSTDSVYPFTSIITITQTDRAADSITFKQTCIDLTSCQYRNMVFDSFFRGDVIDDVVNFENKSSYAMASFSTTRIPTENGTGCVKLPQTGSSDELYVCRFYWVSVYFYAQFWSTSGGGNVAFDTVPVNLIWPNAGNTFVNDSTTNKITVNSRVPNNMYVSIYESCSSSSQNITSSTGQVSIKSPNNDLYQVLQAMKLKWTIVKKKSVSPGNPGNYLSVATPGPSDGFLWSSSSNNNCWTIPVSFSYILPDMSYCADGCWVSFIIADQSGSIYTLQTDGVTTVVTSGTNNGGSGDKKVTASNGWVLGFNAALLLIASIFCF